MHSLGLDKVKKKTCQYLKLNIRLENLSFLKRISFSGH